MSSGRAALLLYASSLLIACSGHNILYFNEFQYTFNLLDSNDWDEHHLTHDYTLNLNSDAPPSRRLISEYHRANLMSTANTDHATKCTDVIPVIFHQLCVSWNAQTGFNYHYEAPDPIASRLHDTDWFYTNPSDKIADAKVSDAYYSNLLGEGDRYGVAQRVHVHFDVPQLLMCYNYSNTDSRTLSPLKMYADSLSLQIYWRRRRVERDQLRQHTVCVFIEFGRIKGPLSAELCHRLF